MAEQPERRQHPRIQRFIECSVQGESGGSVSRIVDISSTGCYVESQLAPGVGQTVTLTVADNDAGLKQLTGNVMAVQYGVGFGVRFQELDDDTRASLERFLTGGT